MPDDTPQTDAPPSNGKGTPVASVTPEEHPAPSPDTPGEEAPRAPSLPSPSPPADGAADDQPISADVDPVTAGGGRRAAGQDHPEALTPDPLLDLGQRRLEAGVDTLSPFGRPGLPLGRQHPFVFGFTAALGVICAWLLVQAVIDARQVIILILVSMFLAVGLNPAVERLQRARLPRGAAVAVVFFGLVTTFVAIGFAVVPPLTSGISDFIDQLPKYIEDLRQNPRIMEYDREHQVLKRAQDTVTDPNFGQGALNGAIGVGQVVLSGIFSTLTVLILTLYFLSSLPTIKTFFYRLAPRSRRARVALLGDEILQRVGGYVAGTVTVAFIAGTMAYIFLSITGIPFALPLALLVGITALIPLVGATIGAVVVCAVAFFQGTWTGVSCVVFFLVYQQIENYVIHPRIMKRAVDVQPTVTIIAALVGGTLMGIVGALMAIPIAAAIALIIREVVVPRQDTL